MYIVACEVYSVNTFCQIKAEHMSNSFLKN